MHACTNVHFDVHVYIYIYVCVYAMYVCMYVCMYVSFMNSTFLYGSIQVLQDRDNNA